MKLSLNHPHNKYATIADTLNSMWKNTATGCLKDKDKPKLRQNVINFFV